MCIIFGNLTPLLDEFQNLFDRYISGVVMTDSLIEEFILLLTGKAVVLVPNVHQQLIDAIDGDDGPTHGDDALEKLLLKSRWSFSLEAVDRKVMRGGWMTTC